jgi:hypothetical protein
MRERERERERESRNDLSMSRTSYYGPIIV